MLGFRNFFIAPNSLKVISLICTNIKEAGSDTKSEDKYYLNNLLLCSFQQLYYIFLN